MSEKEFKSCFFQWRIPKNLRYTMMKEMEKMGLIKTDKKRVYLNNYYFNEEEFNNHIREDYKDPDTKEEKPYLL